MIERLGDLRPNAQEAKRRVADPPVVLALPGSRRGEITRHCRIFGAALARVAAATGVCEVILPTAPHLADQLRAAVADWPVAPRIVLDAAEKWAAFRSARAALAASGTVTLELALAGVPTVAAYRLPFAEATVARLIRLRSRLPSVILANLVLGENVVPELLQEECTPERLAAALAPLVAGGPQRRRQIEAFARLDQIMAIGSVTPSAKAAALVVEVARRGRSDAASALGKA